MLIYIQPLNQVRLTIVDEQQYNLFNPDRNLKPGRLRHDINNEVHRDSTHHLST